MARAAGSRSKCVVKSESSNTTNSFSSKEEGDFDQALSVSGSELAAGAARYVNSFSFLRKDFEEIASKSCSFAEFLNANKSCSDY